MIFIGETNLFACLICGLVIIKTAYVQTIDCECFGRIYGYPQMTDEQPNNPLHGISLEKVVTQLFEHFGWDGLAERINVNCFISDPSIKSSLKFLRKTPWAREKVETLYVSTFVEPKVN